MSRLLVVLVLVASPVLARSARAQVSCTQVGGSTFCDNGQTFMGSGNTTFDNRGNSWTTAGPSTFGNAGDTYVRSGSTTFDNRGNSWTQVGGSTFGSNGTSCTRVGNQLFCD
jgi:hypothetical protein